jgi:uracil-DNA glycosylase
MYIKNENSKIGLSYLLINNINKNWFPFFIENEKLLLKIFSKINCSKIYPEYNNIFNAFTIDPNNIQIILLGQDPYINKNQAHGYSFSVPLNEKIPPSLINIFKELSDEYPNKYKFIHGKNFYEALASVEVSTLRNLEKWSNKGIFLLNSALTVQPGISYSHAKIWNEFTNNVISYLSEKYENKIFLLLGKFAHSKDKLIDKNKHKIVKGIHPSPFSAYKGFFGSNIFKMIDKHLLEYNKEIDWQN